MAISRLWRLVLASGTFLLGFPSVLRDVADVGLMLYCAHAVQTLHVMLQDCMGVGANMGRSDNIAEEGARAVAAVAQGASVAKEMGDVRYRLHQHILPGEQSMMSGMIAGRQCEL